VNENKLRPFIDPYLSRDDCCNQGDIVLETPDNPGTPLVVDWQQESNLTPIGEAETVSPVNPHRSATRHNTGNTKLELKRAKARATESHNVNSDSLTEWEIASIVSHRRT
jgi:hypothetical protein